MCVLKERVFNINTIFLAVTINQRIVASHNFSGTGVKLMTG